MASWVTGKKFRRIFLFFPYILYLNSLASKKNSSVRGVVLLDGFKNVFQAFLKPCKNCFIFSFPFFYEVIIDIQSNEDFT